MSTIKRYFDKQYQKRQKDIKEFNQYVEKFNRRSSALLESAKSPAITREGH